MRKTKNDDLSPGISSNYNSHTCLNFEEQECYRSEPITKIIKKKQKPKKRAYTNISNELRQELIEVVHDCGESIKEASRRLGIKYSCAKAICQVYKREGRFEKKIPRNKSFKKQVYEEIPEITVMSSPFAETQVLHIQDTKNESLEISSSLISDSSLYQEQRTKQIISIDDQEPDYITFGVKSQPLQDVNSVRQPFQLSKFGSWPLTQETPVNFLHYGNILHYAQPQVNLVNQHMLWNAMYYTLSQHIYPQFNYDSYFYGGSQS